MVMPTPVLLLEDNTADAHLLTKMLAEADDQQWQITHVKRLSVALEYLTYASFDVALLGLSLPDSQGLDTLKQIRVAAPDLPIVVLTDIDDRLLALQAVAQGAQDYLVKGQITADLLVRAIRYGIGRGKILKQLQAEVLERQRSEQALRLIVEGTASVTREDFFKALVRSLAEALNVRYALISECVGTDDCVALLPTRVRTFAFWQGDGFGDDMEYDLVGTPCEKVIGSQGCQTYFSQLQSTFPEEEGLVELNAESYSGIALFNSAGKLLGHLAVLDVKPMECEPRNTTILEIFAARAAAEMERRQGEEALRISEEKFSKAFRSSPSAITISALSDGRYIEVNDSCLHMLGYCREEMIERNAIDLGIWAKLEDRQKIWQMLKEKGAVTNLEVQLRRKSGELLLGLLSAEMLHLENEPCLLCVTADITTLKQAEKALAQLAEIGELAAMIVHEVRNPLTTVSMALTAFQRVELSEQFQEYLTLAMEEADRLQRLLEQILLYAKPQTLQQMELDLSDLLPEMVNTLSKMPAAAGKQLEWVSLPMPFWVLADRDKLKQVVINLVTNAFEAIAPGESVHLQLQNQGSGQVCLQVHNGGDPIPPDGLPNLTKPFYTTKVGGNGLGLAIVKRIVEAHNGTLQIESTAATGTTFTVSLPIVATSQGNPE
jgi:PAS domain S-box-containing protein